ncbi:MAG: hypothetical protein PHF46_02535 [Candidatus Gracilibacteria bacterium]|nr:hypothetical protein [Candidatus Gracilibacteria bacterium]MDD3120260.1 hypothetical protein [Candidatus Gracilibacteria bacterium]MDD4530330.1 hypothetical protein [Candidatus Gracilibacteria bacterium]
MFFRLNNDRIININHIIDIVIYNSSPDGGATLYFGYGKNKDFMEKSIGINKEELASLIQYMHSNKLLNNGNYNSDFPIGI